MRPRGPDLNKKRMIDGWMVAMAAENMEIMLLFSLSFVIFYFF